jgi:hypothetical protein
MAYSPKTSEHIYVQGKANWLRNKATNKWNKWSVQLYPNPESLEKIRELQAEGIKNVIKKDEDGYFVNFTRPVTKETKAGKIITFDPPDLFDKEGVPFDGNVGNGSDVTLKLEVYSHPTPGGGVAKAVRWKSAKIDNLVPFETERDGDESTKDALKGLKEQPEQLF